LGGSTRPEGTNFLIAPFAMQLPDGSIDYDGVVDDVVDSGPGIHVNELVDGVTCERLTITIDGARRLSAALLEAVAEIDRSAGR
jgi:hypothetical protein